MGSVLGENDIPHIATWQWQSSFTLVRGKKTLVVESPARVEIMVEKAD